MIVVLMGVAGAGKTTVGIRLAQALGWPFLDADQLHPPESVAKMRAGVPLRDEDRLPWILAVADALRRAEAAGASVVVACSALRAAHRRILASAGRVRFVYLRVPREVALARVGGRRGHFMPASLVASQFGALQEPSDALVVDGTQGVDAVVAGIRAWLEGQEAGGDAL